MVTACRCSPAMLTLRARSLLADGLIRQPSVVRVHVVGRVVEQAADGFLGDLAERSTPISAISRDRSKVSVPRYSAEFTDTTALAARR